MAGYSPVSQIPAGAIIPPPGLAIPQLGTSGSPVLPGKRKV
jgi:hypothetical protein